MYGPSENAWWVGFIRDFFFVEFDFFVRAFSGVFFLLELLSFVILSGMMFLWNC